jgi:prepilin peptidase CpaA
MILTVIAWVLTCITLACLFIAIVTDLACRIIPNRLTVVILFCSVGLRLESGFRPLLASLICAAAILAALGLLASYDLIGWGDAKLIAAISTAVPADRVIPLLFAITLAGGVLSGAYLAARYALRRAVPTCTLVEPQAGRLLGLRRLVNREGTRILANEPMPYALAILGGFAYGLATE